MLLKNRAPSLKSQTNLETMSTNSFIIPANNNPLLDIIPKEEALETDIQYVVNENKINKENSNYCLFEFNDNSYKSGIELLNANLSNSNNNPPNKENISIIELLPANAKPKKSTKKKSRNPTELNSDDKTKISSRKRKSESSLDEFQSPDTVSQEARKYISRTRKTSTSIGKGIINTNTAIPKSLDSGVYVECDACHKTRYLKDVLDPSEIPLVWTCEMEKNKTLNCDMLQENFDDSVDYFINNNYTLGSVVWAKAPGFCWWPAIIDDDPDFHVFYWCYDNSNDVSHYHVTFLDDDVSRSWIANKDIKVFRGKSDMDSMKFKAKKDYTKTMAKAVDKAEECLKLSLQECLNKYSFVVRYTGKPNIWTAEKSPTKRKSRTYSRNTYSDDSSEDTEKIPAPIKKSRIKDTHVRVKAQLEDLNNEVSVIEVKSEYLLTLNQQTKHDLIVKNTSKENKNKTRRKKSKRSEVVEE